MSEIYNEAYYHSGCGPIPYEEPEHWVKFFGAVADHIVTELKPKTVLDAGCAMGYLVAALRDRGVEAYGVDISEYAISKVREDVKPYCVVGSLTEELPEALPRTYDLVVTIEVLEHLYEEDGIRAIANLCKLSDTILFSSTPDDVTERTHVNVQQREYWARRFFAQGFVDDLGYRPVYLTDYATLFRRSQNLSRQVEDYERYIRMTEKENTKREAEWAKAIQDKENHIQNLGILRSAAENQWKQQQDAITAELENSRKNESALTQQRDALAAELERSKERESGLTRQLEQQVERCQKTETDLAHCQLHYQTAIAQREDLKRQLASLQLSYEEITNAFFWKITKPCRVVLIGIKRLLRSNRYTYLFCKGLVSLRRNGVKRTWKKVSDKLHHRQDLPQLAKPLYTQKELEQQRLTQFPRDVKFSILVPLYNTPENFLREMIQSVLDQTYGNWELCLADGSDAGHGSVGKICKQYAAKDDRVRYRKLEKNLGISGNTNACIDMATGDYIALFDHDDLLHPAALYCMMEAITEQDADFLYTDENTFRNTPADAYQPHFKPDFAPDTLRGVNYICHFTAFSRELLEQAGRFRPECDGSQDYDMVLRLTEKARHIVHIPKILYYWRASAASVASDIGAKPYVIEAAHKALRDHLDRVGLKGEVLDGPVASMYRIRYEIAEEALVSIIICTKDHVEDLDKCLRSIREKTTYPNYEIIVVENNSTEPETFAYYETLKDEPNLRVVTWESPNHEFNYSAINNYGAQFAKGKYILLLNNDIEVITPDWIQEMLMFVQRPDVGAAGAKLYYPDDTIQHAGVCLGIGGVGGHLHRNFPRSHPGYMGRLIYAQDLSIVTAACIMVRRDVWDQVDGLDVTFKVAFNDVDLCMRIRKAGYKIVWTPFAELYHYESKSRGYEDTDEKKRRFEGEVHRFQDRWKKELEAGDPYYNPSLPLNREDFGIQP